MLRTIDLSYLDLQTPHDAVAIHWQSDISSGVVECECWRGQYEIDELVKNGCWIVAVEKASKP